MKQRLYLVLAGLLALAAPALLYAADLTITASAIVPATGAQYDAAHNAGETLTQGLCVYLKSSDSKYYKADNNVTSAEAKAAGITVCSALANQPIVVQKSGPLAFGAILTQGETYVVSSTAGGIAPASDLASGNYVTHLGIATSTSKLEIRINATGVTK